MSAIKMLLLIALASGASGCGCRRPDKMEAVCGATFAGHVRISSDKSDCGDGYICYDATVLQHIKAVEPEVSKIKRNARMAQMCGSTYNLNTEWIFVGTPQDGVLTTSACGYEEYIGHLNATAQQAIIDDHKSIVCN